jgi:hypothetical protein
VFFLRWPDLFLFEFLPHTSITMSDVPDSLLQDRPGHQKIDDAFQGKTTEQKEANPAESSASGPTDSHILSQVNPDEEAKALAQKAGEDNQLSDLGWGRSDVIEERIVQGLSNEDLFLLIRRFNKVIHCPEYHFDGLM